MKDAFIKLHISIFLAGFTGVLGKLISLHGSILVWYRLLITSVLFFIFMWLSKKLKNIPLKEVLRIAGVGFLLSLHWVFFYGSIKASNISIGVVCFSLAGFFTAVFDPLINRHKVSYKELFFSIITLVGIALIFHFDMRYRTGIILGVISSALAALFVIANKKVAAKHSSGTMILYEMIGGFVFLSLVLSIYFHYFPVESFVPTAMDIVYLLILSVFCTIIMYLFQIQALRKISAFTINLSYNLEPIYSIAIAVLFMGEAKELNFAFYLGLVLIILSVLLQTFSTITKYKLEKKQ